MTCLDYVQISKVGVSIHEHICLICTDHLH